MASHTPSLNKRELSVEPLEPTTVPPGTFFSVEPGQALPKAPSTTDYVQAQPEPEIPVLAQYQQQSAFTSAQEKPIRVPSENILVESVQAMEIHPQAPALEVSSAPPYVENELLVEPENVVNSHEDGGGSAITTATVSTHSVAENEKLVEHEVNAKETVQNVNADEVRTSSKSGLGSTSGSNPGATVATVEAISKFAAGREKAIQRKIAQDEAEKTHRKNELDSAFRAAAVIGKLSVAREKRIMQKMIDERLEEENAEYEEERKRIMAQAEKKMEELEKEHVRAKDEIQEIGVDVLTSTERDLFEK